MTKKELRQVILKKRDALSAQERKEKSQIITQSVCEHESYRLAEQVLVFASYKTEVDTDAIIQQALSEGKKVYFPRIENGSMDFYQVTDRQQLIDGYCGIKEPVAKDDTQFVPFSSKILILMPGSVFDKAGCRIGYGRGFYDRFLQKHIIGPAWKNITTMALAFSCQIVEMNTIEQDAYDVRVQYLVTEDGIHACHE